MPVTYYMARRGFESVVKIGTTVDLEGRLARYRRAHEGDYYMLAWEPGNVEKERHRQFLSSRLLGEWYFVTPDLARHIWSIAGVSS